MSMVQLKTTRHAKKTKKPRKITTSMRKDNRANTEMN